jgi:acyl dehydratase
MALITIADVEELRRRVGEELGVSEWHEITQVDVNLFAELTHDLQWIHLDVERAAGSPFGRTIAHGLFTLSLGPKLSTEILDFESFAYGVNYGYNRVRFPSPMLVGSRVRMRARLLSVEDIADGVQIAIEQVFEREGSDKPVCVAESLGRLYP